MRIGLAIGLHDQGKAGKDRPRWADIRGHVIAAEQAGFDIAVFEDALTFMGRGHWEAMTTLGALAASTTTIELSHSVVNAATRSPAMIAWSAATLDEISGGRYTLGIGAGNTPDDFEAFGFPVDRKFTRFEESLEIVVSLLREGSVDFAGEFHVGRSERFAPGDRRPVPINVAAKGPRTLRMAARFGDAWNWWGPAGDSTAGVTDLLTDLDRACAEVGRDPEELIKTIDLYSFDILGTQPEPSEWVKQGTAAEMAEAILALGPLGIDEVRCDVIAPEGRRVEAAEAMAEVVQLVHAG